MTSQMALCFPGESLEKTANGFTLIELVVVVALMGLFLTLAIPGFRQAVFVDDAQKNSRFFVGMARKLKYDAIKKSERHMLNISVENQWVWETRESMTEEQRENARENGTPIPGGIRAVGVERPKKGRVSTDPAVIHFYPEGYSDMVLIHFTDKGNQDASILMEPFLSGAKVYDRHVGFQ